MQQQRRPISGLEGFSDKPKIGPIQKVIPWLAKRQLIWAIIYPAFSNKTTCIIHFPFCCHFGQETAKTQWKNWNASKPMKDWKICYFEFQVTTKCRFSVFLVEYFLFFWKKKPLVLGRLKILRGHVPKE